MNLNDNLKVETLRKKVQDFLHPYLAVGEAFFESFLIVQHVLGKTKSQIIIDAEEPVSSDLGAIAFKMAEQRSQGVPMAYLLGYKDFYKHQFLVKSGVLIPRPETELIIERAVETVRDPLHIADLGCGSGCIGLSLLCEYPHARLWACDISSIATELTKQNATLLKLDDRISLETNDVLSFRWTDVFDLIVSNPPYISQNDQRVEDHVRQYEPALALFAEENGLVHYRKWIPWSRDALKSGGVLFFECGQGQAPLIAQICEDMGFVDIKRWKDPAGIERVIEAKKQ